MPFSDANLSLDLTLIVLATRIRASINSAVETFKQLLGIELRYEEAVTTVTIASTTRRLALESLTFRRSSQSIPELCYDNFITWHRFPPNNIGTGSKKIIR